MFRVRPVLVLLLAALQLAIAGTPLLAKSKIDWQTYSVAQLKAAMSTLGVGEHARVIVTSSDGTRLTGYVSQADDTHFVVVAKGQATPVEYDQVMEIRAGNPDTQVKFAARITTEAAALAASTAPLAKPQHQHTRLSNAAKTALVLGVTAGGIVLTLALYGKL